MKNTLKSIVVGVVVLMSSFTANAQKIAHVNLDSLISIMPESKVAQQAVQDYAKQLEKQVTDMQTELQTKYAEYQEKSKDLAEVIRANKEKELNDLNQRIQDFQQQAQTEYQKKSAELSKPVYEKAKKAIDQVAKENGYKYVLDTSTGLVIYNEPADDIFSLVVKKLGITIPANPTPAASKTLAPTTPAPKK
jgi:outer membrane protein